MACGRTWALLSFLSHHFKKEVRSDAQIHHFKDETRWIGGGDINCSKKNQHGSRKRIHTSPNAWCDALNPRAALAVHLLHRPLSHTSFPSPLPSSSLFPSHTFPSSFLFPFPLSAVSTDCTWSKLGNSLLPHPVQFSPELPPTSQSWSCCWRESHRPPREHIWWWPEI